MLRGSGVKLQARTGIVTGNTDVLSSIAELTLGQCESLIVHKKDEWVRKYEFTENQSLPSRFTSMP
jgi:hypothetical protein